MFIKIKKLYVMQNKYYHIKDEIYKMYDKLFHFEM